jgi:ADP-ribose pyrophosphatase YjhB (NUDIX family)
VSREVVEVVLAADAVVFHQDENFIHSLLLIQRSDDGSQALPGGCVEVDSGERVEDACARELAEETGLVVPFDSNTWVPLLARSDPDRDHRGRYISFPFTILLTGPRPSVQGADDALKAEWVPLHELDVDSLAFDHAEIVRAAALSFGTEHLLWKTGLA